MLNMDYMVRGQLPEISENQIKYIPRDIFIATIEVCVNHVL